MLTFPYSVLKPRSFRLDLVGQVISGGITAGGQQQRVNATGGGLWLLNLDFPRFNTPEQIRSWRVVQFSSQGGVAICDLRQAPRSSDWVSGMGVPHSDLSPFSDLSLYSSPSISATLVSSAALRATTIRVNFASDNVPVGGEFFSLEYGDDFNELHVVTSVALVGVNTYDLTFEPPLRAAHAADEFVTFDHPTGSFVLASADGMSMATEYGRWGTGTAAFVEYIAP
jgi:hypothetical protein